MKSSSSQPPENFPPIPEGGGEKKKINTTLIIVIVFIIAILAVAYLIVSTKKVSLPTPSAPQLPESPPLSELEGDEAGPAINLEKDSTADIEGDLGATDTGDIDSEFNSIDEDIQGL